MNLSDFQQGGLKVAFFGLGPPFHYLSYTFPTSGGCSPTRQYNGTGQMDSLKLQTFLFPSDTLIQMSRTFLFLFYARTLKIRLLCVLLVQYVFKRQDDDF